MSSIRKCIEKQINVITQGVLKDAKDVREKINKVNKKRNSVIVPENQWNRPTSATVLQNCFTGGYINQLPELVRISIIMSITHWKIRWGNPPTWPLSNHLVETFCQVLTNKLCVWTSDLSPLYSTCIWCSIKNKINKYNISKNDTNTNIPPLSSCLLYLISEWFKYMNE